MLQEVGESSMDAVKESSKFYFNAFSDQRQKDVRKLFCKMDKDGDGLVTMQEFTKYMAKAGIKDAERCSNLFSGVDTDGNGYIDIEEAKLLYYTLISRPFCGHCNSLVTGMYYTCVKCFKKSKPCDLCPLCYKEKLFIHKHNQFLDNYVMLRMMNTGDHSVFNGHKSSALLGFVEEVVDDVISDVGDSVNCCIM